jgi:hypothetical protein
MRQPDGDPDGDYYRFGAWGTFASDATDPGQASGSGIRWIVLAERLLVPVVDGVSEAQPVGVVDGCPDARTGQPEVFHGDSVELPCDGRTVGTAALQAHTVSWTCVGCLLLDRQTRAVGLTETVKVAEGVVPAWNLYADFGN